jgi:putative cell wall-binding protein
LIEGARDDGGALGTIRATVRRSLLGLVAVAVALLAGGLTPAAQASTDEGPHHPMVFPVIGKVSWTDTFGSPRSDHPHAGQDLMGTKLQELVAAASGTVTYLQQTKISGNLLEITDADGWVYTYIHLNNDTPGTDDGEAERSDTFGPGIEKGASVEAGQLVGYMGDSGNAEDAGTHLHFELKDPSGVTVNAYTALQEATHIDEAKGATPSPIPRLAGVDRVATSVAVSQAGWPSGAPEVVLAAGDRYAEALPASVLAAARRGPLLLTTGSTLADDVRDELDRLGATRVTIVGSVPTEVDAALAEPGRTVERVGVADDATTTAVEVAAAIGGASGTVVLVNGDRFADGVSATAIAAGRGWPVLLTTGTTIPQRTVDEWRALGVRAVELVGGTSVISQKVEDFVRASGRCAGAAGCTVERLSGVDRYATSVAVVERSLALGGRTASSVLLGTGTSYADVLSSGPLASQLGGLALLVDGTGGGADDASRRFLEDNASAVKEPTILGGSGAVNGVADRAVQEALGLRD